MDFLNISPIGFQDKVTLNIEGDSVRVMVTRGKQVTKWGSVPLSPDMIRDGLILDPIVVGSTASALLESQNISTKKAVASLSGLHSSLRILKLPSMARGMLGEAVQRESEKVMPIDLEELHLSWQDLGVEDDQHQIFVLGIPRNMMDTQIQTLQETGLQPHLMDLKPLALMRAVNRKDALIIDVEANDFDIVLVDDGLPAIMRTIFLGQDSLSPQEAADRIVAELSRTVKFYQESHEDSTLSPSTPHFLVGTLGADSQLAELIQTRVDYPIEPLTTPLTYPADFPVNQYVVNIGLALKTPPRMALIKSGPYP
ncbi:MAG: pilus assembly protein PilM, partial [Dehalococcoidia bacterium]